MSVFDAIEELDTQDRNAERKRRKETSAEKKRALEAQNQTKIYNHLLETRILLQRAVNKVNDSSNSGNTNDSLQPDTDSTSSGKSSFRETCDTLLAKLLQTRNQLSSEPPTEESESDSTCNEKYEALLRPSASSSANLNKTLQEEYETHRDDWKKILNRKHKSLRLHSGVTAKSQFRIMDSSFWEQVDATVEYEEIRQNDEKSSSSTSSTKSSMAFDDSKVYQMLLKDFVANSASSAVGGDTSKEALRSSKKYKNNNGSKKKDVDRRASKGRKLRYKEIPKLVNFTFPLSRPNTSSLNRDEYFQSLFGGAGN